MTYYFSLPMGITKNKLIMYPFKTRVQVIKPFKIQYFTLKCYYLILKKYRHESKKT